MVPDDYVLPPRVKAEVERILDGVARRFLDEYFALLDLQRTQPLTAAQQQRRDFLAAHYDGHTMWVRL